MKNITNRKAYFVTVMCYYDQNGASYFRGEIHGNLLTEKHGNKGFGYDPIFVPEGHQMSFAEMSSEEKNTISHRKRALEKFLKFLKK